MLFLLMIAALAFSDSQASSPFHARLEDPVIFVSDIDFGDVLASSNKRVTCEIANASRSDLIVTGYSRRALGSPSRSFTLMTIDEQPPETLFPLRIPPNSKFMFLVMYSPMGELEEHQDSIVFYSDARNVDSICVLRGRGVSTTVVDEANTTQGLRVRISPSPASEVARIDIYQAVQSPFTISITDVMGRQYPLVSGQGSSGASTYPVDVSAYEPGSYVLQVSTDTALSTALFTIVR